jgi:hypothetical protein
VITNQDLEKLIVQARDIGCVIRTKHDRDDYIIGVSVGKLPGEPYRRVGDPGAGWMPPVQAADLLAAVLLAAESH